MRGTKALRRRTPAAGLLAGGIWGEPARANRIEFCLG
jgi:hypothetical protein